MEIGPDGCEVQESRGWRRQIRVNLRPSCSHHQRELWECACVCVCVCVCACAWFCRVAVEDGTAEAHVWFSSETVPALLVLGATEWEGLQWRMRVRGHLRLYARGRDMVSTSLRHCRTEQDGCM